MVSKRASIGIPRHRWRGLGVSYALYQGSAMRISDVVCGPRSLIRVLCPTPVGWNQTMFLRMNDLGQ